jgi:DNA polymerase I-like protein with 3'-5' exonuclease and polymerase domains
MVSTNWAALINPRTGNVHARYQTIGTSTGRMSSSSSGDTNKFNAQQISNVELMVNIEEDRLFEDN